MNPLNMNDNKNVDNFYTYMVCETPYIFLSLMGLLIALILASFGFDFLYADGSRRELNFYILRSLYLTMAAVLYVLIGRALNWRRLRPLKDSKKYKEIKKRVHKQSQEISWLGIFYTAIGGWIVFLLLYIVYDIPDNKFPLIGFLFGFFIALKKWWLNKDRL